MGKDEFRQLVKDYFSFTRSERNGMLILAILLGGIMILNILADQIVLKKPADHSGFIRLAEHLRQQNADTGYPSETLFDFDPNTISDSLLRLLDIPTLLKTNLLRYRSKGGYFRRSEDMKKLYGMTDSLYALIYQYINIRIAEEKGINVKSARISREFHYFDPNTATEEELRLLGFNPFQVRNLVSYRNKGGWFRSESDLMKVYGIDSMFYREIREWIKIGNRTDSYDNKESAGMELNRADSAVLTSLPGIGPVFAGRIIRYRDLLGGFNSVEQLLEVYGITPEKFGRMAQYVTVDPSLITPVRINFADYRTLNRHPYISGEQARKIIEWRSAYGMLAEKTILVEKNLLDSATFNKVRFYLSCQ